MGDLYQYLHIRKEEVGVLMTGVVHDIIEWDPESPELPPGYVPATDVLWPRGEYPIEIDEPGWTFVWSDTGDLDTLVWTDPNPPVEE